MARKMWTATGSPQKYLTNNRFYDIIIIEREVVSMMNITKGLTLKLHYKCYVVRDNRGRAWKLEFDSNGVLQKVSKRA